MKTAELNTYIDSPPIRGRLSHSVIEAFVSTPAEAANVGYRYVDPVLVLLPLLRISPSVALRRQLHAAFAFSTTTMDGDVEVITQKLEWWQASEESPVTLRQSHDATKEMFRVMFACAEKRGEHSSVVSPASRGALVVGVLSSGSPILASFGENFTDYALQRFLSGSSLARA